MARQGPRLHSLEDVMREKLAKVGALGFVMVICTFAGLYTGLYLDRLTGMAPNFTLVCLVAGIALGFRVVFRETIFKKKDQN
jgi:F0F1-type ATP synthase assembly protein I